MPKQKVPDLDFDYFVFGELKKIWDENKIFINQDYQRGDIWKLLQKIELLKSIENRYSIGVLVLFMNDKGQYEILDGQQRLLTIIGYINDNIDLRQTDIIKYSELDIRHKLLLDAYCIYYLKLKSHDAESKEEDIVQTFLRLQEGTPLNKAEKINAYRGKFKDTFRKTSTDHRLFSLLGNDKRFRFRQLAAEMLLIELEGDFENKIFPSLDLQYIIKNGLKKYSKEIPEKKIKYYNGNLDFLYHSLSYLLTGFGSREVISFYLLVSYLRRKKADNSNLNNELAEFAIEFLKNINSFSIYENNPPDGMDKNIFNTYMSYKKESKALTTPDSIKKRLNIMLNEFYRFKPFIEKDPDRLFDIEQKRILFFRQKGICPECNKPLDFNISSGHHGVPHSDGGRTNNLSTAKLLHVRCHKILENKLNKIKNKIPHK